MNAPIAVIGIDIGNSKTDVALVSPEGHVLAAVRGPTASHQQVGAEAAAATLGSLVGRAASQARLDPACRPLAGIVACSAAGADYPHDVALISRGIRGLGIAPAVLVVNDCYSGLRAGTSRAWGVCVICGSGMNCLGVAPTGRVARFDSLGELSGDWGGGGAVGLAGLAAAVRAQDGRGGATSLATVVPGHFGLRRPRDLVMAFYRQRIPFERCLEIAPLVFEAAGAGDRIARSIVDHLADEIVAWATAAIRRARLARLDPEVVLAGGVFGTMDPLFYERIGRGVEAVAPAARLVRLEAPPVVGSVLLGLDRLAGGPAAPEVEARVREGLTLERLDPA